MYRLACPKRPFHDGHMTPHQKAAALVYRIISVLILIYTIASFVGLLLVGARDALLAVGIVYLAMAIVVTALFLLAVPLARISTFGFDKR